jgi:phthiodiolone/phenolphthiodiolone dimycocerosates ketoreductase
MARFGVGVMHNTINSRFGPKPLVHGDYAVGVACGADSFWVADHINSAWPPSIWKPEHVGAARVIPRIDAHLEPWTMLGYLAGRNKLGRMRLGVAVTDTGRRNPAVTAQAAASLHLLTRGRAVLGIGTGERESNEPTAWTGPSRWPASRRPSPPSARCGIPPANRSPAIHLFSRCTRRLLRYRHIAANGRRYGSPPTGRA